MGGNALSFPTKRLEKNEYVNVTSELIGNLNEYFSKNTRISLIPAYSKKETFGDADILLTNTHRADIEDFIKNKLYAKEIVKNGEITSFDFKDFQIDLIFQFPKFYDISFHYFSYNDLGNLIGKIAHNLGFKYGHKGLWYILRTDNNTNVLDKILLSIDIDEILVFLGFSETYSTFDSLEDIFKYVISSDYFSCKSYLYENLNHISRVRDRKRKTYQDFLKFLQLNEITKHNPSINKQFGMDRAVSMFPFLQKQIETSKLKYHFQKQYKTKLMEMYDAIPDIKHLQGKNKGKLISIIKNNIDMQSMFELDKNSVCKHILHLYNSTVFD